MAKTQQAKSGRRSLQKPPKDKNTTPEGPPQQEPPQQDKKSKPLSKAEMEDYKDLEQRAAQGRNHPSPVEMQRLAKYRGRLKKNPQKDDKEE